MKEPQEKIFFAEVVVRRKGRVKQGTHGPPNPTGRREGGRDGGGERRSLVIIGASFPSIVSRSLLEEEVGLLETRLRSRQEPS